MKNIALLLVIPLFFLAKNTTSAQDCLTFWSSSEIVQSGDTARIDVRVKDFNSILSAQYTMDFDPAALEFIEIGNFNLPSLLVSNFGIFPDDRITFSWLDNGLSGISLPDSTVIYSVWFKVLHPEGTASTLSFENTPTAIEVIQLLPDGDHQLFPNFINGQVYAYADPGIDIPTIDTICAFIGNCNGSGPPSFINIDLSGGTPPYSFSWTNNTGGSYDTEDLENVPEGIYRLTVSDQNNWQASALVLLFDGMDIDFGLTFEITNPSCGLDNGAIELNFSTPGDYSFNWNTGNTTQNITDLSSGVYHVTVTNNNTGCQDVRTISLTEESLITGSTYQCEFISDDSISVSHSVVVWAGGIPPYTFNWSNGSSQTDSIFSTIIVTDPIANPQSYAVTITDASGCISDILTIESDCNLSGNSVGISASPANVEVGESICVDVEVTNFTDILSMQFSMHWDPSIISFDSINNFVLPTGTVNNFGNPDVLGPGVLTFAWLESTLTGTSLPNGSAIFQLCFTAIAPGTSTINFTDDPTLIEVIDINEEELSLNPIINTITVGGTVTNDVTIQTVAPTCSQSNGSIELILHIPGDYSFNWNTGANTQNLSNLVEGQYQVTVTNNDTGDQSVHFVDLVEDPFIPGVTFECNYLNDDMVDINLSALVWSGGRSPYTFTWSDGSVETDTLYSTITVSELLTDPQSTYTVTITDASGCTFEPVLVEPDCTNDGELNLSVANASTEVGETVCLDISVDGFNDVASLQFSMNWDTNKLQFESIQAFNLPDLSLNNFNAESELLDGILRFSWLENSTQGITISDNTVLFQLCLTAIDGPGNIPVNFSNDPVIQEAINGDLNSLSIATTNGTVIIGTGGNDIPVQLLLGESIGIPGQEICLPVTCENFSNVASMQFSLNWDPSVIEYTDIIFGNLPALSLSNFGTLGTDEGELRVSWLDPTTSGVSLPDGAPLFEICFVPAGPPGVSQVSFSNDPIPIEFIDAQTNELDFVGSAGQIIVPTNLVWPGDTDESEAVNHFDLLNIGLAFGSTGPVREDANIEWIAQYTEDWDFETPETAINFKHSDTDGNGLVDANDTLAIIQNWGEVTDFWEGENQFNAPVESVLMDVPIYVLPDTIIPGETVDFSIVLGNNNIPANDIYGLAFTVIYDPEVIVENSVGAHFVESWLGEVDANLLGIYRDDYANNKVDIAITRTDLNNVSGQGMIASLRVTIEDVIFSRSEQYELEFEIENVRLINVHEQEIPVLPENNPSIIVDEPTGIQVPEWAKSITLYPIPTKSDLLINAEDVQIEGLRLFSIQGKFLRQFDPKQNSMNMADLPSGSYLLRILTEQGIINRRVEKL